MESALRGAFSWRIGFDAARDREFVSQESFQSRNILSGSASVF